MAYVRRTQPKKDTKEIRLNDVVDREVSDVKSKDSDEDPLSGDYGNIALLMLLYTLQGIPMGLTAAVSLSFQEKGCSLTELNLFSQVSWPFSLKLLWAPIVDAVYVKAFGLRKTWLIPSQLLIGGALLWASYYGDEMMDRPKEEGGPDVWGFTILFFLLFFLCATQDICVDGWALTLLSERNVGWASTCNAMGQTIGNLLSYVGWTMLESYGVKFSQFLSFWSIVFLGTTIFVAVFKREVPTKDIPGVGEAYGEMLQVIRIPAVQQFVLILLTSKIATSAEAMHQTMLMGPVGLPKTDLVTLGTILSVPMILVPKLVSRYTAGSKPFDMFMWCMIPRLLIGLGFGALFYVTPQPFERSFEFYSVLGALSIAQVFASQAMFVAQMGFFTRVSDPRIGGTYMTMLNTIANLAYKFPTAIFMYGVDVLSSQPGPTPGGATVVSTDDNQDQYTGFYPCMWAAFLFGTVWLFLVWSPVQRLQNMNSSEWRAQR